MKTIKTKYGYIKFIDAKYRKNAEGDDPTDWVSEFVIYKKYRGKGYARKLAQLLPPNCSLLAMPMVKLGPGLDLKSLIEFYKTQGFRLSPDSDGNPIMVRKNLLADRFPDDLWGRKARNRARHEHQRIQ